MKDIYYISIIVILIWGFSLVIALGQRPEDNYTHNSEYVLMLEAQLVKSTELMGQFSVRSDSIILLANEATNVTEQAQKDLQECRTRGWHEF